MWRVYLANFSLILLVLLYFPVFLFLFRNPLNNKYLGLLYYPIASFITGIKVRVEGKENIPFVPAVYLFNHQSSLDGIPYAKLALRKSVLIGKRELLFVPIFGWGYWLAGNIFLTRGKARKAAEQLEGAVYALSKRRVSVSIFPEGTRNHETTELLSFKKGGFLIAQKAGVPVVPVVIESFSKVYDKKQKRVTGGWITVSVQPMIESKDIAINELIQKAHNSMTREFQRLSLK